MTDYNIILRINNVQSIDVLSKFVRAYNDTVHSTTGMAPWRETDLDVLAIWKRMSRRRRIRLAEVKFRVGKHVRISKEMKFAKSGEQNFSTEIFRITKL